jgi:aldehyde:ferredoxin oxidoreductase
MAAIGGYVGKTLRVNLTKASIEKGSTNVLPLKAFIGGKGLGAWILYNELAPGTDASSAENKLVFATGPLTGLGPAMAKYAVVTKSPLSGTFLDTLSGGYFASELKRAGYDIVIVEGRASKPSYIRIEDHDVKLVDGSHLWGRGTFETEETIKHEMGDKKARVASIGPAGENRVRFACICNDFGRQAGRGGSGAVMGSKNLKAIAVRGSGQIGVTQSDVYQKITAEFHEKIKTSDESKTRRKYGTWGSVLVANQLGVLATRNFQTTFFEKAEEVGEEAISTHVLEKNMYCFGCPIGCGKLSKVKQGPYIGTTVEGPEFETIGLLGSNCGIHDIDSIVKANELCDDLGMDTISAGGVVGFAMECYERGLLSENILGGLQLTFGNSVAMLETLRMIAYRENVGDFLAEGVKRAAEIIGKGAGDLAVCTKGLEFPAWDPRGAVGMGLAYATSDIGATHTRAFTILSEIKMNRFSTVGKAELVKRMQDQRSLINSLVLCTLSPFDYSDAVAMLEAVTGWDFSDNEAIATGERIFNLTRLFNVREGFARKDDSLPKRMSEPVLTGPIAGHCITPESLEKMLSEYYELRGWGSEGKPKLEKLKELGLFEVKASQRNAR